MSLSEVQPHHVHEAMAEFDSVGRDTFLATYGFSSTREHVLVHGDRSYDSKAVLGVAHLRATGRPVTPEDLSSGKDGAAEVLRDLGFEVRGPDRQGWTTVASVGPEHARATWALAARQRLVEAAGNYHAVVTQAELAEHVQERSRISTPQQIRYWIGDVLGRVTEDCVRRGEPVLSALCVDAEGRVGKSYAAAVATHRGETLTDPDDHAAHERLACYVHFGATLPAGGGEPVSTVRVKVARPRAASTTPRTRATRAVAPQPVAAAPAAPALETCPVHFTVLPSHGRCDYCD